MADSNKEGNFISDSIISVRDLITERFSSPLIFSFVIAWSITNFKVIIIALTDVTTVFTINEKLNLISGVMATSHLLNINGYIVTLLNGIIWPLAISLSYVYIYPYIDLKITKFTLNRKRDIRNARVDAEKGYKYSYDDVQKIHSRYQASQDDSTRKNVHLEDSARILREENEELVKVQRGHANVKSSLELKNDELENKLREIKSSEDHYKLRNNSLLDVIKKSDSIIKSSKKPSDITTPKLNKSQMRLFEFLGSSEAPRFNELDIRQHSKLQFSAASSALSKLIEHGYVVYSPKTNPSYPYSLTVKGKERYESLKTN